MLCAKTPLERTHMHCLAHRHKISCSTPAQLRVVTCPTLSRHTETHTLHHQDSPYIMSADANHFAYMGTDLASRHMQDWCYSTNSGGFKE